MMLTRASLLYVKLFSLNSSPGLRPYAIDSFSLVWLSSKSNYEKILIFGKSMASTIEFTHKECFLPPRKSTPVNESHNM